MLALSSTTSGERSGDHHGPEAEIVLDQSGHGERHGAALPFEQIDLDDIADPDAQNPGAQARNGEAHFRQHDGAQVDGDDTVEIGIAACR